MPGIPFQQIYGFFIGNLAFQPGKYFFIAKPLHRNHPFVAALSTQCPEARLTAVGTNSLAANAMRKAGAPRAATGENAVAVNCRSADIIVGPIGIVIADALLGEITPAMATAVCQSHATRVLIPVNHCENYIVGVPEQPISDLVAAAVQKVKALCAGEGCGKRVY